MATRRLAPGETAAWTEADQLVLAKYAPPGVVINEDLEIVQFRGQTGMFLEPSPGQASLHLMTMARAGLQPALRQLIRQARARQAPARRDGLRVDANGQDRLVNAEVIPFKRAPAPGLFFLVLFEDATPADSRRRSRSAKSAPTPKARSASSKVTSLKAKELQAELASTRTYLQDVIEDQESMNEELRSALEELQSSNEELQSTNEELQTTKQEVESANEELTTLNEELHSRNGELGELNSDVNNLIDNVHLPILIVNQDLHVRRFTPTVTRVLNIVATDVGRLLSEIRSRLNTANWEGWIAGVIDSQQPVEREVQGLDGQWYLMRIRPYHTLNNRTDGAVVVWTDTDQSQEQLRALSGYLNHAREEEQARIARELHDDLGQAMTGIKIELVWVARHLTNQPEQAGEKLQELIGQANEFIEKVRQLTSNLRPSVLDDFGLAAAIEWYAQQFQRRANIHVSLNAAPDDIPLDIERATEVFRIFQETLTNIARHAQATQVDASLETRADQLVLRVHDNGQGISDTEKSNLKAFGLLGMRERAHLLGGRLDIHGGPGEGTTVTLSIPLPGNQTVDLPLVQPQSI